MEIPSCLPVDGCLGSMGTSLNSFQSFKFILKVSVFLGFFKLYVMVTLKPGSESGWGLGVGCCGGGCVGFCLPGWFCCGALREFVQCLLCGGVIRSGLWCWGRWERGTALPWGSPNSHVDPPSVGAHTWMGTRTCCSPGAE